MEPIQTQSTDNRYPWGPGEIRWKSGLGSAQREVLRAALRAGALGLVLAAGLAAAFAAVLPAAGVGHPWLLRSAVFMASPTVEEGFDELYSVSIDPDGGFTVQPMTASVRPG